MKKVLKVTTIILITILICLVSKLDILGFFVLNVNEEKLSNYSKYYFDQLELEEKKMYIKIDEAIEKKKESVFLGIHSNEDITNKLFNVIKAYFYDNPECYYISNEYAISTSDLKFTKYSILKLNYITNTDEQIYIMNKELENAIVDFLQGCITETMTDFEKEVAIHDALVKHVNYYKYEDINTIPSIKHTAYGALVEKEAVCDGYSKAFKLLLDKVGIDSIIISGTTDNVSHAWNLVKLDDEYYHVDVTSDKLEEKADKYVVHTYFNVNDEKISKSHTIDNAFNYPQCASIQYQYYVQKGYTVYSKDNLYNKLQQIISKQKQSDVLELQVTGAYSSKKIINTLYHLNFNNWGSSWKTSVSYSKIDDVYIFIQ